MTAVLLASFLGLCGQRVKFCWRGTIRQTSWSCTASVTIVSCRWIIAERLAFADPALV